MSEEEKRDYIKKLEITKNIIVTQHTSVNPEVSQNIFGQIVCLFNYNQLPQIVSDEEFEKIQSKKYYRGAKAFAYTATLLTGKKYHYGSGVINGIFASDNYATAYNYTRDISYRTNADKILNFKITPKIGITYKKLNSLFCHIYENTPEEISPEIKEKVDIIKEFHETLPQKEQKKVYNCFLRDMSKLAVILGYDFVLDEWLDGNINNISILNRSIINTTQSEVDKFLSHTESWYKDPNME